MHLLGKCSLHLVRCWFVLLMLAVVGRAETQPNIILIVADDMSWSSTSVQMDPNVAESASDFHQTPRLEDLASRGVTFSSGYAAGPICSPSRTALLSGISPAQFHVTHVRQTGDTTHFEFESRFNGQPLTPPQSVRTYEGEKTLADHINDLGTGYRNGFFGKFDWWPHARDSGFHSENIKYFENFTADDPAGAFTMTEDALDFIDGEVAAGRPFFTTIAHEAVKKVGPLSETVDKYEALTPGQRHFSPEYAAAHEDLDTTIGNVLDRVDQLGITDNTYIIFTADHGAAIGLSYAETANKPLFGGKGHLYEGGIRVPYIVAGPDIQGGLSSDVPVTGVDIFSTIYDIAGGSGPADPRVEGASLLPLLENGGELPGGLPIARNHAPNGELFFHYPHYSVDLPEVGPSTPHSAVRDGDYKLVRIYGENGADDEYLLFDLAASLEESSDPNSPLNLAGQHPSIVNSLSAKLTKWLLDVDASLPYDIRDDITLTWRVDSPGELPDYWRSVENVDFRDRERLQWATAREIPSSVASFAHQPRVAKAAVLLDGDTWANRRFFHVGDANDPNIDSDHSATFELWAKLDNLNTEQLFFEAGGQNRGLSVSLGDADGDGSHNDLRFRLLVPGGDTLTVTAPVNQHVDPTQDFFLVSAVVGDAAGDHYIELFVNGQSVGRADGVGVLDWDNFGNGRLGINPTQPTDVGASAGDGDLPFMSDGSLHGLLAGFRFSNFSLTAEEVAQGFLDSLTHPSYGIGAVTGAAATPTSRPLSTAEGEFEQDGTVQALHERNTVLSAPLTIDAAATAGGQVLIQAGSGTTTSIAEGTEIASYLLHFDPETESPEDVDLVGSFSFSSPILGLIFGESLLDATDYLLGSGAGFGDDPRSLELAEFGMFAFSADLRTLSFDLTVDPASLFQLRVITAAPVSGDFDGDGSVTIDDYLLWKSEFGTSGPSLADGNLDGAVDAADFTLWRDAFAASGTSGQRVPEPCCLAFFFFALAAGLLRRRGQR